MKHKPLFRYAGGKTWFTKHEEFGRMVDALKSTGGRLIDPFLGGGAVPLEIGTRLPGQRMILSDKMPWPPSVYRMARDRPHVLHEKLESLADRYPGKDGYLLARGRFNHGQSLPYVDRVILFLFLVHRGFNGVVRFNKSGEYNVPYGGKDRPFCKILSRAENAASSLACAAIDTMDFRETVTEAGCGDVLYLDPPYDKTFTGYNSGGFSVDDQAELAELAFAARQRGSHVVAHNSDTPKVRKWYPEDHWRIIETDERCSVNQAKSVGKRKCLILVAR